MSDFENEYQNESNEYQNESGGYQNDSSGYQSESGRYQSGSYQEINHSYDTGRFRPGSDRPERKKRGGKMKYIFKLVASALVFGIIAGATMTGISVAKDHFIPTNLAKVEVTNAPEETEEKKDANTTANGSQMSSVTTTDVSSVVGQVMPSVVSITCTVKSTNYFYGTQESQGAGSGFLIAKNNQMLYIATNNHVVNGATSLTVGFNDGTTASAEVVGTDADADLAVISVKESEISKDTASKIKIAVLGDSDQIKVGEAVIAIGNALGYGQSVTTGVLSAKDREVSFTDGTMVLLQTDAAINPGNSGGVLINNKGQVIGINNAKLSDTSVEGMGYAIPITTAKEILTDLMNATTIKEDDQAFLGVVGKNIDTQYSQALGMPSGIYVSQVVSGSPAETAGISAGDIIVGIDGKAVSTMTGLKDKLARKAAGTKITIELKRSNQNGDYEDQTINVTLGKKGDFKDVEMEEDNNQNQQNGQNGQNGQQYDEDYEDNYNGGYYIDPFEFFFGRGGNSFFGR